MLDPTWPASFYTWTPTQVPDVHYIRFISNWSHVLMLRLTFAWPRLSSNVIGKAWLPHNCEVIFDEICCLLFKVPDVACQSIQESLIVTSTVITVHYTQSWFTASAEWHHVDRSFKVHYLLTGTGCAVVTDSEIQHSTDNHTIWTLACMAATPPSRLMASQPIWSSNLEPNMLTKTAALVPLPRSHSREEVPSPVLYMCNVPESVFNGAGNTFFVQNFFEWIANRNHGSYMKLNGEQRDTGHVWQHKRDARIVSKWSPN